MTKAWSLSLIYERLAWPVSFWNLAITQAKKIALVSDGEGVESKIESNLKFEQLSRKKKRKISMNKCNY